MFDIVTEAKLFREYIQPGVDNQIIASSKLWDRFQKSDKLQLGGKLAKQTVRVGNSQAARASNSSIYPVAQESTPAQTLVYLKRAMMFTMKFDGFALETAQNAGTAMDPEKFEEEGILETVIDKMSRQVIGDGSGIICQAKGAGSGATALIVDSPYYADLTRFLKKGQVIDSYLAASQEIDSKAISDFDTATQTATIPSSTWTDNSNIRDEDTYGGVAEAAGTGEMMGLLGIVSNADPPEPNATLGLQGLLVASYPSWKAVVKSNGGVKRALTEDLILSAFDDIEMGNITVMLYTAKLRRVWASILREYKITDAKEMWGGWVGLPFYYDGKNIPMVVDRFMPDGTILGLDESQFTLYLTNKGKIVTWEEGRAGGYLQKVAGANQYQAEAHIFANLGVRTRRANFKISDLDEPTA